MEREPEHFLQLASGASFNLTGPISRVSIFDVADGLAKINRFCGATRVPYSVAQHSVHVSLLVKKRGGDLAEQMSGLMHDAHEIAVGDIPSPTKRLLSGGLFRSIEKDIQSRASMPAGMDCREMTSPVALCDLIALATEKRDLMLPSEREWFALPDPDKKIIKPVGWKASRKLFLARFFKLKTKLSLEQWEC